MQKKYDIIIAGLGGAGMLLAWELSQNPTLKFTILLIDKAPKKGNDRTWSFWAEEGNSLDEIIYKQWHKLRFHSPTFSAELNTAPYTYYTIRSAAFYRHVHNAIEKDPRFSTHYANILHIEDKVGSVEVATETNSFRAKHVFDSLLSHEKFAQQVAKYTLLWQHFKGWFVKTEEEIFRPDIPTMFDFNIPQEGKVQFVYILPFSKTEALVEYTIFSEAAFEQKKYDKFLKIYMQKLTMSSYNIEEKEFGMIPMTDAPLPLNNGNRIHFIGTKGGLCKASTGYAFRRMQEDAQAIVKGLLGKGVPQRRKTKSRFLWYDAIILHQMKQNGGAVAYYFSKLFQKHRMKGMLTFLDEKTNVPKELSIMGTVPPLPFMASFREIVKRKVKK